MKKNLQIWRRGSESDNSSPFSGVKTIDFTGNPSVSDSTRFNPILSFWTPFWTPLPSSLFTIGTIFWRRFICMVPSKHLRVVGAKDFQSTENWRPVWNQGLPKMHLAVGFSLVRIEMWSPDFSRVMRRLREHDNVRRKHASVAGRDATQASATVEKIQLDGQKPLNATWVEIVHERGENS